MTKPPDQPTGQDGEKKPIPPIAAADNSGNAGGDKPSCGSSNFGFHSFKLWLEVMLLIFGLIAVPLAVKSWIESEIDKSVSKTLSDPANLQKIAEHSRPSLIFNAKESIVADMGALSYVDPKDIRVTKRTDAGLPSHIHIGFVRACRTPPILTPILDVVEITTKPGKGLDWEFDLDWSQWRQGKPDSDIRFRLEVIP